MNVHRLTRLGVRHPGDARHQPEVNAMLSAPYPTAPGLMRTVVLIGQGRTSKIMLNGVSVARRNRLKPASVTT